jgi:hypothetical protein
MGDRAQELAPSAIIEIALVALGIVGSSTPLKRRDAAGFTRFKQTQATSV